MTQPLVYIDFVSWDVIDEMPWLFFMAYYIFHRKETLSLNLSPDFGKHNFYYMSNIENE